MSAKCPYCNGNLTNGNATIHGTLGGFLLVGLSHQNLYFKSENEKEIKILGSNFSTPAVRCNNCDIVILNKEITEKNYRNILIELLTLSSSKELQDSIKESDSTIDIFEDIKEIWLDFYQTQNTDFKEIFSDNELLTLSQINDLISEENWIKLEIVADNMLNSMTIN